MLLTSIDNFAMGLYIMASVFCKQHFCPMLSHTHKFYSNYKNFIGAIQMKDIKTNFCGFIETVLFNKMSIG